MLIHYDGIEREPAREQLEPFWLESKHSRVVFQARADKGEKIMSSGKLGESPAKERLKWLLLIVLSGMYIYLAITSYRLESKTHNSTRLSTPPQDDISTTLFLTLTLTTNT
jgi:hypothetical protein